MAFGRASQLFVFLSLAVAQAGGAAAQRVTLAPGASRTCTGEMTARIVNQLGQPAPSDMAQTEAMSETLSVRQTGGHYELRHSSTAPEGQTVLIANIRPDGTVVDATATGHMATLAGGGDQVQRLAMLAARMLPERLLMGREFRPGDGLYTDAENQDILSGLAGLSGAMGLPAEFDFESTGNLPFTGTTGEGASRTLEFTGPLTGSGSAAVGGETIRFDISGHATTRLDATTGLLRGTAMDGTMDFKVNGVSQMVMHIRQSMTCIITSGTA